MEDGGALYGLSERYRAVQVAGEIGFLDFASLLLAIVAILLALAGVVAFFNFRSLARKQATEEARKIAAEIAERIAVEKLEAELPNMLQEYSDLVKNSLNAEEADRVASAQNQGGP
ncbi:MAG: hypothetical protein OXI22_15490 [Defluviicoccus sp.]|nr:hypothetical protein [Defluviicoccus sp.]MDE0385286.1 hypothetical protein [Defluviicoccus sp.]